MPAKRARLGLRLAIAERGMFVRIGSRIRTATFSVGVLCCGVFSAAPAEISIDVGLPSAAIGLHVQQYPNLVPVPRYPVYYAADLNSNLYFLRRAVLGLRAGQLV